MLELQHPEIPDNMTDDHETIPIDFASFNFIQDFDSKRKHVSKSYCVFLSIYKPSSLQICGNIPQHQLCSWGC